MSSADGPRFAEGEWVLPCGELGDTLEFFQGTLGFRLDALWPAEAPVVALLSGHDMRLRLDAATDAAPRTGAAPPHAAFLRLVDSELAAGEERLLSAPNGTRILLAGPEGERVLPAFEPKFTLLRAGAEDAWGTGRAGMQYRDLVPDRLGGRVIASHIRIPSGGPVPDYTHYHRVGFQTIFCHRGWVEVAYEGQGPAFVLREGDLVLQAPEIRHRVLACSDGLEVVEVTSPAWHETRVDHALELPAPEDRPNRDFGGQYFHRHVAADAPFAPSELPGFEAQATGIQGASAGVGNVRRLRPAQGEGDAGASQCDVDLRHDDAFHLLFVRAGALRLRVEGEVTQRMEVADACQIPAGLGYCLEDPSDDCELLEVTLARG